MDPSGAHARKSGFLKAEPSPFLGREGELRALDEPLMDHSLVTVVGPPGMGKTRLTLRYGTTRQHAYASVWFCDLTEASDAEEAIAIVLRTIAKGASAASIDVATAASRALAARQGALLILDDVDHLRPAISTVIHRWIATAPEVRFLVTSRTPLEVPGERVVRLGALRTPEPGNTEGDAVDLFVERVRARLSSYAPLEEDLDSIAEIVRRLRGVPLAIELAAARVGLERPREILPRVSAPAAHASGEDTQASRALRRAFALLPQAERSTLCQCSIFRGSFTLHQVERVIVTEGANASDVVVELAQKHILQIERFQPMRFSMCEGIRSLATEALLSSPDLEATEQRHAEYMAERASIVAGLEDRPAPADAADDWDDLRAAMAFGARTQQSEIVLRAALAIDALALGSGLGSAQLAWLEGALDDARDPVLRARAMLTRANALYGVGRAKESLESAQAALALANELGDRRQIGGALRAAANAAFQLGELGIAQQHLTLALEIERERGDLVALANVHHLRCSVYQSLGERALARQEIERALALAARSGSSAMEARATMSLAWDKFESGDHAGAIESFERALVLTRRLKMARAERICVGYIGVLRFVAQELEAAESHLRRAAFACRQAGDFSVEAFFEGARGAVLATLDCADEARQSFELAEQLLVGNAFYGGTVAVHRGHLDLAEAREARARGWHEKAETLELSARARVEAARASRDAEPPLVARSDDARLAVALLERALSAGE